MQFLSLFRGTTRTLLTLGVLLVLIGAGVLVVVKRSQNRVLVGVTTEDSSSPQDTDNDMYDGAGAAAQFEFERTKDVSLGRVPSERLLPALYEAQRSKEEAIQREQLRQEMVVKAARSGSDVVSPNLPAAPLNWAERGSNSDSTGITNGNTRANSGVTSGRIRGVLVDAADATGKTVWIGGVAGGLWKTTDITASPATWTNVSDFFSNLAVSDIVQQPGNPSVMYFSTGEAYFNADAVRGNGVFKSTNGGATWAPLGSTAGMTCSRMAIDAAGTIYLATNGNGLLRSINGGTTWTDITPTGADIRIADVKLSSTGRLHVATGIFSTYLYRYTDNPTTVTAGTWTTPAAGFPTAGRIELAVSGATVYALPSDGSFQVPTIYKSTDGGANWAPTAGQPTAGWASGQGWYALAVDINPADSNQVIVAGLDAYKTTDGGATWNQISHWVGTSVGWQYSHADHHRIKWYDSGNKLLFANDGGIFFSSDGGTTIRDRNVGLRLKQFYSVAIHPSTNNYFLAGAQDNGTHQFSNAGLSSSVEVTGGDGAFVAIDQSSPLKQFGAYVFSQYRRSTDGGVTWGSVNFSSSQGQFINPFDYDSQTGALYSGYSNGTFLRWPNAGGANVADQPAVSNMQGAVTAVTVSPYTANRVFLGTNAGKVYRIDNANTFVSGSTATADLSTGLPFGTLSCIALGTDDNHLMAILSNYGLTNIWVSTDGGTSWTGSDGNLPDMPVRWGVFLAGSNTQAYIATEAGVWETTALAGAGTTWSANATFPIVRTDMIKYRPTGQIYAAATHGRGLWTSSPLITTAAGVTVSGRVLSSDGNGVRNATVTLTGQDGHTMVAKTSAFGYYTFSDVPTGASFVLGGSAKGLTFRPQIVNVIEELSGLDLIAIR